MRLFVVLAALAAGIGAALACCTAYPGDRPVRLVGEQVIIVWDAAKKVQHFVRQASFEGEAENFGFIVPTPTKPEVAVADEKAFGRLMKLIPKKSEPAAAAEGGFEMADAKSEVQVIEQYKVGDYLATILKADDGKAMLKWLEQNGYDSRPAMETWLDHYAKQDWVFTALKFIRKPEDSDPKTTALRLSFKTEVPHYPYKMPSDTWPEGHIRPLTLYFVAKGEPAPVYRDSKDQWEAERLWSGPLPQNQVAGLAKEIGLKPEDIPNGAKVTILMNYQNKHGYDRDLDFAMAPVSLPPAALIGFGLAGVAALVYGFRALAGKNPLPSASSMAQ